MLGKCREFDAPRQTLQCIIKYNTAVVVGWKLRWFYQLADPTYTHLLIFEQHFYMACYIHVSVIFAAFQLVIVMSRFSKMSLL